MGAEGGKKKRLSERTMMRGHAWQEERHVLSGPLAGPIAGYHFRDSNWSWICWEMPAYNRPSISPQYAVTLHN